MIKILQKKFIISSMTAISILLIFLIGAINIANIFITENQINKTVEIISKNNGDPNNLPPIHSNRSEKKLERIPPEFSVKAPKNDYDIFMSSTFFIVRLDKDGQVVFSDVSRTSAIDENDAVILAQKVCEENKERGRVGKYRFCVSRNAVVDDYTVVFLDTSDEMVSYIRVLVLSCVMGIVCWGIMLLLVSLLSKKAIKPIAENMEKQKQFVTNAGHEIKTPLAIIQSNTEAMELYNGETKWSKNIKVQTVRLTGLMNQLLLLARMDEGGLQAQVTEFSLSELITETMQEFLQPMEIKGISIGCDIQSDVAFCGDKDQIGQLLSILYDNAVKYADADGEIAVGLQQQDRQITFRIENSCVSLPTVHPDKLFDRFYRADSARTQKNGGYGIGLSVARAIVTANKGVIYAEYVGENKIRFVVRFGVP